MAFIVQETETALFLKPYQGDVGYTQFAHEAGRFDHLGEAMETAQFVLSAPFFITEVVS